jgi:glycosyltransferase involved in cell wall biosynthesis
MSYVPLGSELVLQNGEFTRDQRNAFSKRINDSKKFSRDAPKKSGRGFSRNGSSGKTFSIIVHCHLCWDWVWQRPQQFMSRLSARHKILFVETVAPDPSLASPLARIHHPAEFPNLTILRIQFPLWRWSDAAYVDSERRRLVQEFLAGPGAGEFENPVQWFYDPMAFPAFAGEMNEALTVYDCMDELSKFRAAPPEIRSREAQLLELADVVFTGGRKLYESKRLANRNCHFHGCGVDIAHFGKAREPDTRVPSDLAAMRKPVLGYFGVVDERMDYELAAKLADAQPDWNIAIVGPVLKVEASALPQRANLHWLGRRDYADLPGYCKGFDVCLMPFALNESTEFINPTKALEYMAAGRQIVSSAVPDVVSNFSSVVKIAADHDDFIQLCRDAILNPDNGAIERGLRMASENSWESIVAQLENHIEDALTARRAAGAIA